MGDVVNLMWSGVEQFRVASAKFMYFLGVFNHTK